MQILKSKKGFTLVELIIVVVVISILTAVAIPVYNYTAENQQREDCLMQRIVIETVVDEVMNGMIDNGKKQEVINFDLANQKHVATSPKNFPAGYANEKCFKLTYDANAFTLGDIRGGYRPNTIATYDDGCDAGYFLKKSALEDTAFYTQLATGELPYCKFNDDEDVQKYFYYIFADGTVLCSCPDCLAAE